MSSQIVRCVYFDQAGTENTEDTLKLAKRRAQELGIEHIIVASTSGETGHRAAKVFEEYNTVVVSHSTGFSAPNEQELSEEHGQAIEELGASLLTCQHALGGIGRAVRRKLGSYQIDEIIAFTLRTFGQGMKVACEITMMAADAGLVPADEKVIAIGGTGHGADTAAVIMAANAQDYFEMRVCEILCKPRQWS